MPNNQHHLFGPFRLDPVNEQVWRGEEEIILRRKTFDVLRHLVDRPGQLVTKAALLDAIWPGVVVSDSMPTISVGELRNALGDEAKTPQFIETVHGRGYRFISKVSSAAVERGVRPRSSRPEAPPIVVGRDAELARLQNLLERALEGRRQILFVAGEAGIGKTALVRTFLDSVGKADPAIQIARGQCVEQYGESEPYMPMLEGLTRLCRESGDQRLVEILRRLAPEWVTQMPALIAASDRAQLLEETRGATQQRMLREIAEALEAMTADRPLVLLFEDLHWSDFSTLEMIAAVARRSEPARLLLLGSYRPVKMLGSDHPLRMMKEELELHRYCQEVQLSALDEEKVGDYLARRFPGAKSSRVGRLASAIHKRSEGNPLFMINVVEFLIESGILRSSDETGADGTVEEVTSYHIDIPHSIRQMIERNLERLKPEEQALLECASVAGAQFSAASLAAAVKRDIAEIETCCTRLSRHEQFVRMEGPISWPDGTVAESFRFRHTLYQEVLYDRVPAGHRVKLHQLLAEREEAAFGERAGEIAAQLAHHFSRANNRHKAILYFQLAAELAAARGALLEAERLFAAALEHLKELPESVERDRRELPLQVGLGSALRGGKGWSHPETEQAFTRARELSERLGEVRRLVEVLHGLAVAAGSRAQMRSAIEVVRRMLLLAQRSGEDDLLSVGNCLMGIALLWRGELGEARAHLELAASYTNENDLRPLALRSRKMIPVVASLVALHQGFPDRARLLLGQQLAMEESPENSYFLGTARFYACYMSIMLRDPAALLEHADALERLSTQQPFFRFHPGYNAEVASLMRGERLGGLPRTEAAKAFWNAIEFRLSRVGVLETEALYCASQGRFNDALTRVGQALNEAEEVSLREPALLRFRAYLLRKTGAIVPDIEACYRAAIASAQKQGNRFDELQCVTHFARWLKSQDRADEARALLSTVYNWFSEGFDTAPLNEARNVLDEVLINSKKRTRRQV